MAGRKKGDDTAAQEIRLLDTWLKKQGSSYEESAAEQRKKMLVQLMTTYSDDLIELIETSPEKEMEGQK